MSSGNETHIAEMALAAHPVATLVVDLNGRALYSNAAANKAFGLDTDPSGSTGSCISAWQLHRMPLTDLLRTASSSSNWIPAIFYKDGKTVHARMRGLRSAGSATPRVLITSVADVTTSFAIHSQQIAKLNAQLALYQKTARELQASVEVSKVLEREMVHRVKNNLTIISALLNQQARSAEDQIVSDALKSAASRIRSIAVVHDILDTRHQSEVVDLDDIIVELVDGIREAFCPRHVQIRTDVECAEVHTDVALPLALLINELVTNSIKHAFVDRTSGQVDVQCSIRNANIEIHVVDDGVGIPVDETQLPRMVTALAEQIGATIECRVTAGTEWTIVVPCTGDAVIGVLA